MPSRSNRRRSVLFLAVLLALAAWFLRDAFRTAPPRVVTEHAGPWFTVVRVVDGDTVDLDNGERIRLRGVDAPESRPSRGKSVEPCGAEASEFVRNLLLGRRVRLEQDWETHDNTPQRRVLAYLFLEDGTDVNAEIIRRGYAHAYRKFDYREKRRFIGLEREAHRDRVGCLPRLAPGMPRE